jgi:[ribosomal protein S5]-alanine N-acetyltransferase
LASPDPLPTIALGALGWTIRAWCEDDAPALATHANNVNIWRWMSDSFPHPYTLEMAEYWCAQGHIDFGGDNWAIALQGAAVGGCGMNPQQGQFRCNAEVGWWLAEEHWGRGIVTRVAAALTEHAFADPQITRVFAPVHAGNQRSMRVAEKNGFVLEGVQPKSAIKNGQVIDRCIWATYRE